MDSAKAGNTERFITRPGRAETAGTSTGGKETSDVASEGECELAQIAQNP
jgi:hypothetical protein